MADESQIKTVDVPVAGEPKLPHYDIVVSSNFSGLANATNAAIARGYLPIGGPFSHKTSDPDMQPWLGQAMIRHVPASEFALLREG